MNNRILDNISFNTFILKKYLILFVVNPEINNDYATRKFI